MHSLLPWYCIFKPIGVAQPISNFQSLHNYLVSSYFTTKIDQVSSTHSFLHVVLLLLGLPQAHAEVIAPSSYRSMFIMGSVNTVEIICFIFDIVIQIQHHLQHTIGPVQTNVLASLLVLQNVYLTEESEDKMLLIRVYKNQEAYITQVTEKTNAHSPFGEGYKYACMLQIFNTNNDIDKYSEYMALNPILFFTVWLRRPRVARRRN